ncbi:chemotaxis protein CheC [uncultured Methanospirillum sp.]|uniref:chemotaxis protein CheC n=1 Tax=uncultured Methanospirillum sp. TaxID=262503 RepID=UPI0029C60CD1|nr:chemotaxis protein CheC [uncultured Methanospirillum sp.]
MTSEVSTDGSILLSKEQSEEIWELGNAGAQNAAAALSTLLNQKVTIRLPSILVVNLSNLQEHIDDTIAAMVIFQIKGQVSAGGSLVLHVPKPSILRLSHIMLGQPEDDREIDEMDQSMLHEIGNIMMSSYLDACATLLSIILLPSPPSMAIDMAHAVLESIIATHEVEDNADQVLFFKTEMRCAEQEIDAELFLLPSRALLKELLDRFRKVRAENTG